MFKGGIKETSNSLKEELERFKQEKGRLKKNNKDRKREVFEMKKLESIERIE